MTRHTKIFVGRIHNGMDDSEDPSIAKDINEAIATATAYSVSVTRKGKIMIACVVWDSA